MINCDNFNRLVERARTSSLDDEEWDSFLDHESNCARHTQAAAQRQPSDEELIRNCLARLERELHKPHSTRRPRVSLRRLTFAPAAVAALLILGGGGLALVLRPSPPVRPEVEPAPQVRPPPPELSAVAPPWKPPEPAPQPPKVAGVLEVTSNVAGTVKVGKLERKIPSGRTVRFELKPNKYDVELINPETGYWMKQAKQVEIRKEETVSVKLEVSKGQVVVSAPGAGDVDVYFDKDAQPRGKAPERFELPEGRHVIRVTSNKRPQPYIEEIVIGPGEEKRVVARFQ